MSRNLLRPLLFSFLSSSYSSSTSSDSLSLTKKWWDFPREPKNKNKWAPIDGEKLWMETMEIERDKNEEEWEEH